MFQIIIQTISTLFLLYVYLKISDERESHKTFLNGFKSASVILAAAAVLNYGKNLIVLMSAITIGLVALVKRIKHPNGNALLDKMDK